MNKEEVYNEIKKRNINIDNDLVSGFLEDKYLLKLPFHIIEYCINYPIVQQRIMQLNDYQLDIFSKIITYCIETKQDWIPPSANFIRTINNPNFKNLINSLNGKNLTKDEIRNLIFCTINYGNFYNIQDFEDLTKFSEIKRKLTEEFTTSDDPNLILLSKYGLSYDTAKKYYKRFGKDIKELPDSLEKSFLQDIENILKGKGTKDRNFSNIDFLNNLDSNLRNFFVKIYNKELYKIDEKSVLITKVFYNNMEIPVYDAGVDFTMSIYSFGLAKDLKEPENFYENWNRPYSKSEYFCNSLISSSNMRTTIKHCVYGFSSFDYNDIQLLAANDLGTGSIEDNPNVTSFFNESKLIADVEFRIPKEMSNYTRFTNNEVYRKRRRMINGRLEKVNPDYIVYFKEHNDIDVENDPIWQKTLKAASQFTKDGKPLPIVVVDCEKCLKYNLSLLEENISMFEKSYEYTNNLKVIVEHFYTLIFGYNKNEYLSKKYLSSEILMEYFLRILNHIEKMGDIAPNNALACINLIIQTLDLEYVKQLSSPYWVKVYTKGKELPKDEKLHNILNKLKQKIEFKINNNFKNNLQQ